jgi:membrane associated rhomboid family serine protease
VSQREPIFNVPGVVLGLLVAFFAVYLLRSVLPTEQNAWLTDVLAFIPARMDGLVADLPGGRIAAVTSFVTYQFVHGDLTHLLINSAWLLAFGTPVARRTDPVRFLAFFLMTGIAGAVAFLAVKGSIPIRLMSLPETLSDRRILMAIVGWSLLNVLFALWGGPMLTDADGIAWEAHLGGFYAGLLLYGFFDRPPPPTEDDDVALAE